MGSLRGLRMVSSATCSGLNKLCYNSERMISQFVEQSLKRAKYKILEDGSYYANVPRLRGVWAQGKNLEECRQELSEVIEEWLLLKVHLHDTVPGLPFSHPMLRVAAHA